MLSSGFYCAKVELLIYTIYYNRRNEQ